MQTVFIFIQDGQYAYICIYRVKALEDWLMKTGVRLTQVNGQRKYGGPPPGWTGPPPGSGSEVFISDIPRDLYEDYLIPLFQSVGQLYEFRLMMNFSGQNRGFAYAKYGDSAVAASAIRQLHRFRLPSGTLLVVRRSTDKRQLLLGDLPHSLVREELLDILNGLSDGVQAVTIRTMQVGTLGDKKTSALVQYSSHHAASMAKKEVMQVFKKRYGTPITVKWMCFSRPEEDVQKERPVAQTTPKMNPRPPPPSFFLSSRFQPHPVPCPAAQSFPRAVGSPLVCLHKQGVDLPKDCAVGQSPAVGGPQRNADLLLRRLCETCNLGEPLYSWRFCSAGLDGFVCFAYHVSIPGLPAPVRGLVQVLPGAPGHSLEQELRRSIAERVLQTLADA
uniref:RRM domain-containing protein n=1 Tax=Denticeps clupeoides TaxID=299321 RepID=A0AAY4CJ81_9TELE